MARKSLCSVHKNKTTNLLLICVLLLLHSPLSSAFQAIRGVINNNIKQLKNNRRPITLGRITSKTTGHTKNSLSNDGERSAPSAVAVPPLALKKERSYDLENNDGSDATAPVVTSIEYDERRRSMLFSMLAAAAGGASSDAYLRKALAAETATADDDGLSTKTTAGRSLRTPDFTGIIKPPLDDSEYVAYTLDNGLRVLLCSDPSTNEAAAAMDVHVGACSDPDTVPGLAHFTEHMLFLGTKKYPKEESFESFLATNGGTSNAYTDSENTVYFFAMNAEADRKFSEGLDRFGSFFTNPLFTESATGRELNAIDSENAKNLQSDVFRNYQINKSRSNPNHPFSKFFTGNKKTLLEDTRAQNIDLRQELIKFHSRYYSANQMTLAVTAPQSIETLKKMIDAAFLDVPNRNVGQPEESWMGISPFTSDNSIIPSFRYMVEIVPVSDLRQVQIQWPIVYKSDRDRVLSLLNKPSEYVAHLLGHEGPKSLLSYLKRKGWANTLGCSTSEELSDFEAFEISVGLTSQGLAVVDKVVEAIFSYISMMKDRPIPDYVFKEVLQLEEMRWRFLSKGNPGGYAQSLTTSMQKYPPALYVAGPRRLALDEYAVDPQLSSLPRSSFPSKQQLDRNQEQVNSFLDSMTVDNAMVSVLSKSFDGQTSLKEKWYGTDYNVRPIPPATLELWRNCAKPRDLKIDFPKPNLFIPSEAGLRAKYTPDESTKKKKTFEERMTPRIPPRIIRDDGPDGRWTVYFKEDRQFGKPKGYIVFQVLTKEVFASPMNAALANLYEISVQDRLDEYAYDAELAGLTYEIRVLPRGVRLTFGGYNDKLKKFASFVSRKLSVEVRDLLPRDDNDFDRYKDQLMRGLSAFDVRQPYSHASYYAQLLLQPRRFQYTNKELREATRKTTLPDLASYVASLWSSGKGEALIQGNYDEAEALDLVKSIGDVIPFKPIPESEYPPRLEALPLPTSFAKTVPPRLLVAEPNPANENSVSYVMLQSLDKSEKDHILMDIVSSVVEEPFYNELRTKRQLGYIVASAVRGLAETRTLNFIVQSSIAPSDALTLQILEFLDTIEKNILQKLSNIDLAVYVKSLIDKKTEPDKELATEVTRNWSEISNGRFQFDRQQREAAALLDVEKEDVLDFWRRIYAADGRRILIAEMIPRNGAASSDLPPTSLGYNSKGFDETGVKQLGIDDIEDFRRVTEKLVYSNTGERDFPDYTKSSFQIVGGNKVKEPLEV